MNAQISIKNEIIETKRLLLRAFKKDDVDDFYEYAKVEGVGERAGWKHHENKEESEKIIGMFIKGDHTFAIVLKENNKLIGSIGLDSYDENIFENLKNYKGLDIGFVLSETYHSQGLMTEAILAVIDFLFDDLCIDFILCNHFLENTASKRVQEKCGFKMLKNRVLTTNMGTKKDAATRILINPNSPIKYEKIW